MHACYNNILTLKLYYHTTYDDYSIVSSGSFLNRNQSVDASFQFDLPPHLIIKSSNIKLTETIGQGLEALTVTSV